MIEIPKIKIILEVSLPDKDGGPPQRFSVTRALRAKWKENPQETSLEILEEIKNYKGSFIGDVVHCLNSLVRSEKRLVTKQQAKNLDVTKWVASMIEGIIYSAIKDGMHGPYLENLEVFDWDGSSRDIEEVSQEDVKNVDIEKLLILLSPKIKHALFLIGKDINK